MISIPKEFEERIKQVHGNEGALWIESLPGVISFCQHKWNIKAAEPFTLSFNYVASVKFNDGEEAVLKLCLPGKDCSSEINFLKTYDGVSMCRLIDSVGERGVLLIERLWPGDNLKTVEYDVAAVKIAAMLMKRMRDKAPKTESFQTISEWAQGISKMRKCFDGGTGPFSETIVRKVEELFPMLISSQRNCYLLHGDLHHENILLNNGEWKLIDPKGIVGEVEYEIIRFIVSNLPDINFETLIENRIKVFHKELGVTIERVHAWGLCHSLLSVWWSIEDNLSVSEHDLAVINHFYGRLKS